MITQRPQEYRFEMYETTLDTLKEIYKNYRYKPT